jgi:dihydroorotase
MIRRHLSNLNSSKTKLTIKNVLTHKNEIITIERPYHQNISIDAGGLLCLPNLIDPHVHFRTPGLEHKEDWITGSRAAFKGGITTVFDMPNVIPPTTTAERLKQKFSKIEFQLAQSKLPLNYKLFFGVEEDTLGEIEKVKDKIIGLKVFMDNELKSPNSNEDKYFNNIFQIAQKCNLTVALHAEDYTIVNNNTKKYENNEEIHIHSCVRSKQAAIIAIEKVICLVRKYNVRAYILHVSTKDEIDIITNAKREGLPIHAEICPHYLFLDESMYPILQGKCKINPAIRTKTDVSHAWEAINEGKYDTIASDHAPHTAKEKQNIRRRCPSGVPGIETMLPLFLTAWKENRIEISRIIELMHTNPKKIFKLENELVNDFVLVNMKDYKIVNDEELATKVKWSPFSGMKLTGFPKYLYTNNYLYDLDMI